MPCTYISLHKAACPRGRGVLEKPTQTPHTQSPGGHSPTVFLATCNGQNSHGRSTGRQSPSGYIEALTGANGRVSPRVVQDSNLRQPDLRSGALPVELTPRVVNPAFVTTHSRNAPAPITNCMRRRAPLAR